MEVGKQSEKAGTPTVDAREPKGPEQSRKYHQTFPLLTTRFQLNSFLAPPMVGIGHQPTDKDPENEKKLEEGEVEDLMMGMESKRWVDDISSEKKEISAFKHVKRQAADALSSIEGLFGGGGAGKFSILHILSNYSLILTSHQQQAVTHYPV